MASPANETGASSGAPHIDTPTSGTSHPGAAAAPTLPNSVEMTALTPQHDPVSGGDSSSHLLPSPQPANPSAPAEDAPAIASQPQASSSSSSASPQQDQPLGQASSTAAVPVTTTAAAPATTPSPPSPLSAQPPVEDATEDSSEAIAPAEGQGDSSPSAVNITLLPLNGNRHPYKITAKYLQKQNVKFDNNDPFTISVYQLKQLIFREWRTEWETKPISPDYIRLINLGKLLDDKQALKDCRFNAEGPTVLHMSVKPHQDPDDEDGKMGKTSSRIDRDGSERTPGCRCVIL